MNSMKCPQCGLVNWATADACKRCRLPFNGAEAPDIQSWEESSDGYAREPVYQLGDDGYHEASYGYAPGVDVAPKTGLAIASMVVGIVSMVACGLLGIGSITGLVLGIVAFVKAKNSPLKYGGQGFAVAGVVLSVMSLFWTGIVMAIAIPNLIASYRAANEGSAIRNMRALVNAESIYQSSGSTGKYGTLLELSAAGLTDKALATGAKNNYVFEIKTDGTTYEVMATPVKDSDFMGRSFYYSSEEGFLRGAKKEGVPATAFDPPIDQNNPSNYRQSSTRDREREFTPPANSPLYQN